MRRIEAYKVDAFTTTPYAGNPAGVVPDAKGLTEREMQQIAREMNVSETAFLLPATKPGADLKLRYFTPRSEVDLCGHATVATFHVLSSTGRLPKPKLKLETNVGILDIEVVDGTIWMQSDRVVIEPSPLGPAEVAQLLGTKHVADAMIVKRKLFATVPGLKAMESLRPDLPAIARLYEEQGIDGVVPVSFETQDRANLTHIRYFVPGVGIDEDPVTGTAHMALAGYLLRLGKIATLDASSGPRPRRVPGAPARFTGEQGAFCGRPGTVIVEVEGDANDGAGQGSGFALAAAAGPRVRIGGRAVVSFEGALRL